MSIQLLPIHQALEENKDFINNPLCTETLQMCIDYYKMTGFVPPWICYYASHNGELVGSAAYKGAPKNNTVEIAYGTFEPFRQQGIGAIICKELVTFALAANSSLRITARTLPETNFSTRILEKNNFVFVGVVDDADDGEVWEWEYRQKEKEKE